MTYTVKYRKHGSFFWNKIKDVKGDYLNEDGTRIAFIRKDEEKIEIPLVGTEIIWGKERFTVILKQMQKESGNKVVLNDDI